MTPEDMAALGARLLLVQRCYFTVAQVTAMPDHAVLALAAAFGGDR